MGDHPSYAVYETLPLFFRSRGLAAVPPPPASARKGLNADRSRFMLELDHFGYFRAEGETPEGRLVIVLLLATRGKFSEHGPQLRQLLAGLSDEEAARRGRLAEVLVIAPDEVLAKKNLTDIVAEFRPAPGEGGVLHALYAYHVFSLDLPRAQCVPLHELVPPAEVEALLARERLTERDLKTMPCSDPPLIWIGARPGQVVRTTSPSETAGESIDYWLVIRG
jgi:DNA-directed RNA polymerase subunit H